MTKILLVEDQEWIASEITKDLQALGYEVVHKKSYNSAIRYIIGEERPDFIILDRQLPMYDDDMEDMQIDGGFYLISEIQRLKERRSFDTPCIIWTSDPDEGFIEKAEKLKADEAIANYFNGKRVPDIMHLLPIGRDTSKDPQILPR